LSRHAHGGIPQRQEPHTRWREALLPSDRALSGRRPHSLLSAAEEVAETWHLLFDEGKKLSLNIIKPTEPQLLGTN